MQGFRLTQEMQEAGFSGGSVKIGNLGHMFDVGTAIADSGGGPFFVNDDTVGETLANYPALERIPAEEIPEDAVPVALPLHEPIITGTVPYISQTPGEAAVLGTEIAAQHQDMQDDDVQSALAAGENVSGPAAEQSAPVAGWPNPTAGNPTTEQVDQ